MNSFTSRLTFLITCFALVAVLAPAALAADFDLTPPQVTIENVWARPAIEGGNGAVYFVITNTGQDAVTLIGASAEVANVVELHQTVLLTDEDIHQLGDDVHVHDHDHGAHDHDHDHDAHHHDHHNHGMDHGGGTFVMLHLDNIVIDAGERLVFEPAGHHIMLIDLVQTLVWDSSFPLVLHFLDAQSITVDVAVGDQL